MFFGRRISQKYDPKELGIDKRNQDQTNGMNKLIRVEKLNQMLLYTLFLKWYG